MRSLLVVLALVLTAARPACAQDDHPNTRTTAATPITVDGPTVPGRIEVGGDRDWFRVPLSAGITYSVYTTSLGAGMDSVLSVYTPSNSTVGSDDNGGGGLASRLTFVAASTGHFYVRLTHRSTSGTGTYELGVTRGGPAPAPTPPAAPTGLAAQSMGPGRVELAWLDASSDETSFQVERRRVGSSSYTLVDTLPAGASAFADVSVSEGTAYEYRVLSANAAGRTASAPVAATTWPTPPTSVVATATSGVDVRLTWVDASLGETGHRLERRAPGGTFAAIGTAPADATSAQVGATEGTALEYRVVAVNAGGASPSLVASVTTPPAAPTDLAATAVSPTRVELTWTDNSSRETAYRVERWGPGNLPAQVLAALAPDTTAYADTTVSGNGDYVYRVCAVGPGGETADGRMVSTVLIAAPSEVRTAGFAPSTIGVTWRDRSPNDSGFRVERRVAGAGPFAPLASVPPDVTSYFDVGVTPGVAYEYQVIASDGTIDSPPAATGPRTIRIEGPTQLQAVAGSGTHVFLTWVDNSASETGFRIERSRRFASSFNTVGTTLPDETSFVDRSASPETDYEYLVYAVSPSPAGAVSPPSERTLVTTLAAAPPAPPVGANGLRAVAAGSFRVDLTWTDGATDETAYRVERRAPGGTFAALGAALAANATAYSDLSPVAGATLEYRVVAATPGGDVPSDVAAVTLPRSSAVTNGDFATRDLRGWELTGPTGPPFQALVTTNGATASYGLTLRGLGDGRRYELRQQVLLGAGDVAAEVKVRMVTSIAHPDCGVVSLLLDGAQVARHDFGAQPANASVRVTLGGTVSGVAAGPHVLSLVFERASAATVPEHTISVDDVRLTGTACPPAPAAPTGLQLTGSTLRWTDASTTEAAFRIERSAVGGSFVEVGRVAADATSFTVAPVAPGEAFLFRVFATNASGDSAPSNVAATPSPAPPAEPMGLMAATTWGAVRLSWIDASSDETALRVERRASGAAAFERLATLAAGATTYDDDRVEPRATYDYRVVASNDGGDSTPATLTVTTAGPPPVPATPTGLTATPLGPNRVALAWTDQATDETGYRVERADVRESEFVRFYPVATLAANATSFVDDVHAGAPYEYRVVATGPSGGSFPSQTARARTPVLPAPSALAAGVATAGWVELSWVDNATWETGYRVERRRRDAASITPWDVVARLGADATSAVDRTAAAGVDYHYHVVAETVAGESASDWIWVWIGHAPPPNAPSALRAVAASPTRVELTWSDHATTEVGFRIDRRRAPGAFLPLATVGADVTTFTDSSVVPERTYEYRVVALSHGGPSAAAPAAAVRLPRGGALRNGDFDAGDARGWTVLAGQPANRTIDVDGDGVATPALLVRDASCALAQAVRLTAGSLEMRVSASGPARVLLLVDDVLIASAHLRDLGGRTTVRGSTTVTPGLHEVRLVVDGFNTYSEETFLDDVVLSGTAIPAAPASPVALGVTATAAGRVDLAWGDASADEVGFRIERSPAAGGGFVEVGRTAAGTTTFSDTTVRAGTAYLYRAFAWNEGGDSASSNVAATPAQTRPSAPSGLVASTTGPALVTLTWSDRSTNETGFRIERRLSTGWVYTRLAFTGPGVTSFTDAGAEPLTAYDYRVIAVNESGDSSPARVSATTGAPGLAPAPPGALGANATPAGVLLVWTPSADALTVRIERDAGGGWRVHDVAANSGTYLDAAVVPGTTYRYTITKLGSGASSVTSGAASATVAPRPPVAPASGLRAEARGPFRALLTWSDDADDETGHRVERRRLGAAGSFAQVAALPADAECWVDASAEPGATYEYRVLATLGGVDAAPTLAAVTAPPAPSPANADFETRDLRGWTTFAPTASPAVFEADDVDLDADGVRSWAALVLRTGDDHQVGLAQDVWLQAGALELSVTAGAAAHSYSAPANGTVALVFDGVVVAQHTFPTSGTWHTVLRASLPSVTAGRHEVRLMVRRGWISSDSAPLHRFDDLRLSGPAVIVRPDAPTGLAAARVTAGVRLTWTDASSGERAFRIERSPPGGGSFVEVGRAAANATSFTDATAAAGVAYDYRLLATNEAGDSAPAVVPAP